MKHSLNCNSYCGYYIFVLFYQGVKSLFFSTSCTTMADKHKQFESHAQQKSLWFENSQSSCIWRRGRVILNDMHARNSKEDVHIIKCPQMINHHGVIKEKQTLDLQNTFCHFPQRTTHQLRPTCHFPNNHIEI